MAVICPICGAENPDTAEYCNLCLGSMGFNPSNCALPVKEDHSVYHGNYPSSFQADTSEQADDEFAQAPPKAAPADIGTYGERSGYEFELSVASGPKQEEPPTSPQQARYKRSRRTR